MEKIEALENIKNLWNDDQISLGDKILKISTDFYSVGLDLETTAAFIKATPAELDAMLALGELDDESISIISEINPPKITWAILASAGEEELKQALDVLANEKIKNACTKEHTLSEYIYQQMLVVAEPTAQQKIANLSGNDISHLRKKATEFNLISKKEEGFLYNLIKSKKIGKTLSEGQLKWLNDILTRMIDNGAIKRNSIDGDQELCDRVLDALGR